MSSKGAKAAASDVLLYEEDHCRRRRWLEAHPAYRLLLMTFVITLNLIIVVKYTYPAFGSSLLANSIANSPFPISSPDEQILLGAKLLRGGWPVQKYKSESFLAPDMTINKTGQTSNGYLFINPWGNGTDAIGPTVITDANELIWHGPSSDSTNLRVQSLHGQPVLTYWNGTSTATFGHACGSISVLDNTYSKIAQICMKDLDLKVDNNLKCACSLDMHESYLTDHGTIIATAYNVTSYDLSSVNGPKKGWIFDSIFYEIDIMTEEVLFRWRSLDHVKDIPITDSLEPLKVNDGKHGYSEDLPWDYFHINSVQFLDNGYLVNARHTFAMYKIDKKGKVEWQLQGIHGGDFSLAPGIRFAWQHHPRILHSAGSKLRISLYNNDNSKTDLGTHETTGLDLTLDLDTKTALLNRQLRDPADPIFAASQGSHQALPGGHVLLGHGQIAKVKEFNAVGDVVYTAQFGASTKTQLVASYRAHRYEWHATPRHAPKIAAESSGALTNVYMSWNGATNVQHWSVRAGDSKSELEHVATVPKFGFETEVSLPRAFKYVQAEALQQSGSGEVSQVLRRSSAVELVRFI